MRIISLDLRHHPIQHPPTHLYKFAKPKDMLPKLIDPDASNMRGNSSLISRIQERAFTLIELLVVIAILAILAALVIPASRMAAAAKKKSRARSELKQVETFIELYKVSLNF